MNAKRSLGFKSLVKLMGVSPSPSRTFMSKKVEGQGTEVGREKLVTGGVNPVEVLVILG